MISLKSVGSCIIDEGHQVYPLMANGEPSDDDGVHILDVTEEWWSKLSNRDFFRALKVYDVAMYARACEAYHRTEALRKRRYHKANSEKALLERKRRLIGAVISQLKHDLTDRESFEEAPFEELFSSVPEEVLISYLPSVCNHREHGVYGQADFLRKEELH